MLILIDAAEEGGQRIGGTQISNVGDQVNDGKYATHRAIQLGWHVAHEHKAVCYLA